MTDLRVLSLWQPWATLWADPALPKTIETRPKPVPSTIHLPTWVLIHAAAKEPQHLSRVGEWTYHHSAYTDDGRAELRRLGSVWDGELVPDRYQRGLAVPLPLGAVIGAAHITECLPIRSGTGPCDVPCIVLSEWEKRGYPGRSPYPALVLAPDPFAEGAAIDADLPYGDYTPGRWGYVADRTVVFPEPIPWRGAQGWQRATPDLIAQTKEYLT